MRFRDFTVLAGRVHSERLHESAALAPGAVAITDRMVAALRSGVLRVPHGVDGLPPFEVGLGIPEWREAFAEADAGLARRMAAPMRFFSIYGPAGRPGDAARGPVSVNLVLPRLPEDDPRAESDRRAVGTLLGLSLGLSGATAGDAEAATAELERLWRGRPFLATVLSPAAVVAGRALVSVAADFTTVFAASLLRAEPASR